MNGVKLNRYRNAIDVRLFDMRDFGGRTEYGLSFRNTRSLAGLEQCSKMAMWKVDSIIRDVRFLMLRTSAGQPARNLLGLEHKLSYRLKLALFKQFAGCLRTCQLRILTRPCTNCYEPGVLLEAAGRDPSCRLQRPPAAQPRGNRRAGADGGQLGGPHAAAAAGGPGHGRALVRHVQLSFYRNPNPCFVKCDPGLKKNGTRCWICMCPDVGYVEHSGFIGRAPWPDSPPAITQSMSERSIPSNVAPNNGSHETRTSAGIFRRIYTCKILLSFNRHTSSNIFFGHESWP